MRDFKGTAFFIATAGEGVVATWTVVGGCTERAQGFTTPLFGGKLSPVWLYEYRKQHWRRLSVTTTQFSRPRNAGLSVYVYMYGIK